MAPFFKLNRKKSQNAIFTIKTAKKGDKQYFSTLIMTH